MEFEELKKVQTPCKGFLSLGKKQTVHNNEVSILSGCP